MNSSAKSPESKIIWIFVTVFDNEYGRSIACKYPPEFQSQFTKDQLHRLTSLTITREELTNRIISFKAFQYHVIGCPQRIDNKYYERNTFMFNIAFLLPGNLAPHEHHAYEVMVRKLNHSMATHERHSHFITRQLQKERLNVGAVTVLSPANEQSPLLPNCTTPAGNKDPDANDTGGIHSETPSSTTSVQPHPESDERRLEDIIRDVFTQLNALGECSVRVDDSGSLHMKKVGLWQPQVEVSEEDVPILCQDSGTISSLFCETDLTTQQLLPFLDGQQHVAKIAQLSGVEMRLVKSCLQNLHSFGAIYLLPSFLFSASYLCLPRMREFMQDQQMQAQCFSYAFLLDSKEQQVTPQSRTNAIRNILRFYALLRPGATLRDIIGNFNDMCKVLDICRVIRFAEIHRLIVRIHEYPIFNFGRTCNTDGQTALTGGTDGCGGLLGTPIKSKKTLELLDGLHSTDNIACYLKERVLDLETSLRQDPSIDIVRY